MSSTNRGYDRHISDYYVTPLLPIESALNKFIAITGINLSSCRVLDPCAGGSDKDVMAYPHVLEQIFGVSNITTMDIREDSLAKYKRDYLLCKPKAKFDIIITNPPFHIAMQIILKALDDVKEDGFVILLLRLNFFGTEGRFEFFEKCMPKYCFVHYKRMNFIPAWLRDKLKAETGKKLNGDSIEYAHFIWHKGHYTDTCKLSII